MASLLVVDDEDIIREVLKELLERAGYDVRVASDGDAAIKMFQEKPADLIIIDIVMPNKNGVDTIKALREEKPDILSIAISGGGQAGVLAYKPEALQTAAFLAAAESVGANVALAKPFSTKELLSAVNGLMR